MADDIFQDEYRATAAAVGRQRAIADDIFHDGRVRYSGANPDQHLGLAFWVEIDGLEIAGFSECSGLQIETEVFEYNEGGLNEFAHKLPVRTKYSNITLKRGLDPGHDLYSWFLATLKRLATGKKIRRNVTIHLYGTEVNKPPVRSWSLRNAYPVKWTGPDLKSDAGAVAVETVEFAHSGLIFNNANYVDEHVPPNK